MFRNRIWNRSFAAVTLCLLAACSSDDDDSSTPNIGWQPCTQNTSIDCGTLDVPVDYSVPNGEKISLGLRRIAALNVDSDRILLINPGGPGASGTHLFDNEEPSDFFPKRILEEFTVIGFDPRGIGESGSVTCDELGFNDRDFFPFSDTEVRDHVTKVSQLAEQCFDKYGDYLLHLGTINVARDMEEIRKATGAEKLDFIGASYGTRLGAVYLQNFPENSGAFVLDAVVPPNAFTAGEAAARQVTAKKRVLQTLLSGCNETTTDCEGVMQVQRLESRLDTLLTALGNNELPVDVESFDLLEAEIGLLLAITLGVVEDPELGGFARGPLLSYLENFELTPLNDFVNMLESDDNENAGEDNEQAGDSEEGDDTALIAIWCADDAERPTAESLIELLPQLNARSDIYAEAGMPVAAFCAGWKPALTPLEPIATNTAPAALLIGGTTDQITPIEILYEMNDAIGGYAISSDHIGHTVVFDQQSQCVNDQVIAYLIDGAAPTQLSCSLEE